MIELSVFDPPAHEAVTIGESGSGYVIQLEAGTWMEADGERLLGDLEARHANSR